MNSGNDIITQAAERLRVAATSKVACAPIRDLIGIEDLDKAYAIQAINTQLKVDGGARIVGRKIGLTSKAVQKQLGVDQADFGMLWQDTEILNGDDISMQALMQPKAEAEIAFVLGKDLDGQKLSTIDIISAIDYALVSIEIVGSRIQNWDIKITDTIADNASASHWVVGHKPVKLDQLDLINCAMTVEKNGEVVSEGFGKNCLGSPLNAMLWLAQKMVDIGSPMKAGELILTGALGPMTPVVAGDKLVAKIEGLGEVSVGFVD